MEEGLKQTLEHEGKLQDKSKEKLALAALQKQLQILNLKEIMIIASFIFAGALGRVLMQPLPSVEPITFFAIMAGWLFGSKRGFVAGASSLYISNFFVFGGQGPWTLFQAAGFGIAGFLGGFLRKDAAVFECFTVTLVSTLIFEIIMNASSVIFIPSTIFTAFFLGIPFLIIHVVSNSIFSFILPKTKKYIEKTGNFDEMEICMILLNKLRGKNGI